METRLNALEARVLGSLIEKSIATPEYYPLSLHALVNACNQKSNREPVMHVGEDAIRLALRGLSDKGLAGNAGGAESRVPKFEHRWIERFNLTRPQTAILCELLLRGAQTPGELRSRADRLHAFSDLDQIHAALRQLMEFDPPLVVALPRQPGTKEIRFGELLSMPVDLSPADPAASTMESDRMARLERRLETQQAEIESLRRALDELRPKGA